jgi:hypothetical protein
LKEVSAEVIVGEGYTLLDKMLEASVLPSPNTGLVEERKKETQVAPLGSGSDYTVFLQHLGVASSNLGFGAGPKDPVYHYHSVSNDPVEGL